MDIFGLYLAQEPRNRISNEKANPDEPGFYLEGHGDFVLSDDDED